MGDDYPCVLRKMKTQKELTLNNLEKEKQDMLDELRTLVNNKQMQLEIKVSKVVGEIKAYKPADKFKLMADKNPSLLELKKRFDLDIEY